MSNKVKKLEAKVEYQNSEINKLNKVVEKLKEKIENFFNYGTPEKEPGKKQHKYLFPELKPNNYPDELNERKGRRIKKNRLR
ncbi:hypothetical protein [Vibrio salilacus]|uniref:hypothetical protein n=1 Tax=Vibrio salilacus TaxID=1323749 RepID=UPI000C2A06D7|nr:hypothetical protein [Vibrio salilacus]